MRSGWKNLVLSATVWGTALAGEVWVPKAGALEVKNVTAVQMWPWSSVEIDYEVDGDIPPGSSLVVMAADHANQVSHVAEPDTLCCAEPSEDGVRRLSWDLGKQNEHFDLVSSNIEFTVAYMLSARYCVVDVSGGENAESYPVTWMDSPPSGGFNQTLYKTTQLVLRRIEPGTFMAGRRSTDWPGEGDFLREVTLTNVFYIGVFEVTQRQWELVMGNNPSQFKGTMRPVEMVRFEDIRGTDARQNVTSMSPYQQNGSGVNPTTFIGRLRAKTGLPFELPLEDEWEYACRAGTTTALNSGKNVTVCPDDANNDKCPNMAKVGRYMHNSGAEFELPLIGGILVCDADWKGGYTNHTAVGCYWANNWGLYDMHGNVSELCVGQSLVSQTGLNGRARGGSWTDRAWWCMSGSIGWPTTDLPKYSKGFRLSCLSGTSSVGSPKTAMPINQDERGGRVSGESDESNFKQDGEKNP